MPYTLRNQWNKSGDEREFLPALLEIQETPVLPAARWLLRAIVLFFAAAIAWAWIGRVDVVASAAGRTVPGGRVKVIQPLESAVIRGIFVREGDRVAQGQVLIEFDSTQATADLRQLQVEELALRADGARLETLLDASRESAAEPGGPDPSKVLEAALQSRLPPEPGKPDSGVTVQRMLGEWRAYQSELQVLEQEITQRRAEHASVQERIGQLDATLPLITERAESAKQLAARQLAPRMQWLELEQQRIERVKERDIQSRQSSAVAAGTAGLVQQQAARKAAFRQKLYSELEGTQRRLHLLEQEMLKAEEHISRRTLNAPVAGTVQRLAVHTVGGIVTPAQELMHIVPEDDRLEVEAWILNRDIGYVHRGQAAAIKVETFPFTKFGTLAGTLHGVAADAVPDERFGPVFPARVMLHRQEMMVNGAAIQLTPGMAVTVELKLGSRRIIEFLLSPLLRFRDESLRER